MLPEYEAQIEQVLGSSFQDGSIKLELSFGSVAEAKLIKKRLTQMQRELRAIKSAINNEMKLIRAEYNSKIANVSSSMGSVVGSLIFGRKASGRFNAMEKQALREERDRVLAPYQDTKNTIDRIIIQLDSGKVTIDQWILSQSDN
ncbi:MAG: hypothetical protein Kow0077_19450 [Anaerolineae bacterium]